MKPVQSETEWRRGEALLPLLTARTSVADNYPGDRAYCTFSSARRFIARPSGLSLPFFMLSATGSDSPLPTVSRRPASTPRDTRYCSTARARRSDNLWLYASEPMESVWPSIITLMFGLSFKICAASSRTGTNSSLILALSKSKLIPRRTILFGGAGGGGGGGAAAALRPVEQAVVVAAPLQPSNNRSWRLVWRLRRRQSPYQDRHQNHR